MYGSLTAIVLLMLWLYVCICILFLGAEINYFYSGGLEGNKEDRWMVICRSFSVFYVFCYYICDLKIPTVS